MIASAVVLPTDVAARSADNVAIFYGFIIHDRLEIYSPASISTSGGGGEVIDRREWVATLLLSIGGNRKSSCGLASDVSATGIRWL